MKTETCRADELKVGDRWRLLDTEPWATIYATQFESTEFTSKHIRLETDNFRFLGTYLPHARLVYVQRKTETLTVDKAKLEKVLRYVNLAGSGAPVYSAREGYTEHARIILKEMLDGSHD